MPFSEQEILIDPEIFKDALEGHAQSKRGEGQSWREIHGDV